MQSTAFILGREPELSVAELEGRAADWQGSVQVLSSAVALLNHPEPLPERMLNRLGGSIKQVDVLERWPINGSVVTTLNAQLTSQWVAALFGPTGRIEFGISAYDTSRTDRGIVQKIALRLKKELVASGRIVRCVTSKDDQLSAVTVQRNGLVTKGKEIILVQSGPDIIVGVTTAVQDYQLYGLRDFGRPAANAKSGMLPPKVAQMMLNIAHVQSTDVLLDPFCGSGTILQEAALMGVRHIHGSDAEARPVQDSQENLKWLMSEFEGLTTDIEITRRPAEEVTVGADVIVTEPYLGKPLRGHEPKDWLELQAKDLGHLYIQCFEQWAKHVKPNARVAMIWPEFVVGEADVTIKAEVAITKLGWRMVPLLSEDAARVFHVDQPNVLTYAREDAKVRRQIRLWQRV
jgi:tRNA G10  N-methylase Trm11